MVCNPGLHFFVDERGIGEVVFIGGIVFIVELVVCKV